MKRLGLVVALSTIASIALSLGTACFMTESVSDDPLVQAAENGDPEAQRQLGNRFEPGTADDAEIGDVEKAVYWYRKACAAGYANGQIDFYNFAYVHAHTADPRYLDEAILCLQQAIEQGHRNAIVAGAFRAAFIDKDVPRGFYLYALLTESDPGYAEQRWTLSDELSRETINQLERDAAAWRSQNRVKDYNDFFLEVASPFGRAAP